MTILQIPGVQEAAVVNKTKTLDSDVLLTAFVTTTGSVAKSIVEDHIKRELGFRKQLTGGVVFVEQLPKNQVC